MPGGGGAPAGTGGADRVQRPDGAHGRAGRVRQRPPNPRRHLHDHGAGARRPSRTHHGGCRTRAARRASTSSSSGSARPRSSCAGRTALRSPEPRYSLERGTFPFDKLNGVTDGYGTLRLVNISEGAFSVHVEEAITGLSGRASAVLVRDAEQSVVVTITPSGRVTGRFLSADGLQPIPFAQVALTSAAIRAFTTTDTAGRFELLAIPVGNFTVEASDPATGRLGRATDTLLFEGQHVDVTVLQLARGIVTRRSSSRLTAPPSSRRQRPDGERQLRSRTDLQATTRRDGSFRFEGVPLGRFTLTARDPIGRFRRAASPAASPSRTRPSTRPISAGAVRRAQSRGEIRRRPASAECHFYDLERPRLRAHRRRRRDRPMHLRVPAARRRIRSSPARSPTAGDGGHSTGDSDGGRPDRRA